MMATGDRFPPTVQSGDWQNKHPSGSPSLPTTGKVIPLVIKKLLRVPYHPTGTGHVRASDEYNITFSSTLLMMYCIYARGYVGGEK
jgi:hypothetical protein